MRSIPHNIRDFPYGLKAGRPPAVWKKGRRPGPVLPAAGRSPKKWADTRPQEEERSKRGGSGNYSRGPTMIRSASFS